MKYLVGIDEAGRGPLAGPVAVGVALVKQGFDWSQFGRLRDSKKMTALARERFFKQKTAYEISRSDWSSDVCSSDLPHHRSPRYRHSYDTRNGACASAP